MKFQQVTVFQAKPYYFNCRSCGEPLFIEGDTAHTEKQRALGYCAACRHPQPYTPTRTFVIRTVMSRKQLLRVLGERALA